MPLFPEKDPGEEAVASNVRMPRRMWERLDKIADSEGKSRAEVIIFFLGWACDDYDAAKQQKHAHSPKSAKR